jgi:hypothetical protein
MRSFLGGKTPFPPISLEVISGSFPRCLKCELGPAAWMFAAGK